MLIDGHALIYRAFYAFPTLTTKKGVMVNAVYGFMRILLTVIRDFNPEYLVVCFDMPKPTFRHTEFVGYKAQRKEMPEELKGQIDLVKEVVGVLNIPQYGIEGYEADDVIGTLACKLTKDEEFQENITDVLIVTGDRDAFQLVTDRVHVLFPAYGKRGEEEFDAEGVLRKMDVTPDQIVDFKALAGDASDNIPGVKGIGEKTAIRLIKEFGSVSGIYEAIKEKTDKVKNSQVLKGAVLKKIVEGYESAMLSFRLATIDQHVPLQLTLDDCRVAGYDKEKAIKMLEDYEFKTLIKLLPADDFEKGLADALF